MHVALEEPELVDELPANYPAARPRRYGACLRLGLGITMPCPFATCRYSLLSDELKGEMWDGEADLGDRPTCSLAVASEGRHSSVTLAKLTTHCESSIEEWVRRSIRAFKAGLGIAEFNWPPKHRGFKVLAAETDGLAALVEALFRRGLPPLKTSPVRHLTRDEVEATYPGKVHPRYGQPKEERAVSRALGGAAAAPAEKEEENLKETAAPAARESNTQDRGARHVDSLLIDKYKCD
jgi:hypothetical protein